MTTWERIKKIFLTNFNFPEELIRPETSIESMGLDSLDWIELMFLVEKEFDIIVPEREITFRSLQDVLDAVETLVLQSNGMQSVSQDGAE